MTESCPAGQACNVPGSGGTCAVIPTPTPAPLGAACTAPAECAAGNCVDGVCCAVAECPAGEVCNLFGTTGHCALPPTSTPVTPSATPGTTPTPLPTLALLSVATVNAAPGESVRVDVTLHTMGLLVAGTQNDIGFDPVSIPIAATVAGKPDCQVNPQINKNGTSFGFLPPGCQGNGCTGIRALVFALDNTDTIPDGSVLYTCTVDVTANAAAGVYPLVVSGIVASDPNGNPIPRAGGVNGGVYLILGGPTATATATPYPAQLGVRCFDDSQCISGHCTDGACCKTEYCPAGQSCNVPGSGGTCAVIPTPTPAPLGAACTAPAECATGNCVDGVCCAMAECPAGEACNLFGTAGHCAMPATPTPTATAVPVEAAPLLSVGTVTAQPGESVHVDVTLHTMGLLVAGTQNDIGFDPASIPIAATVAGKPDCQVNPQINKNGTVFGFQPPGCQGNACTGIRALVFALDNTDAIPDGSVLYTCTVDVSLDAAVGIYPLSITGVTVSDAAGDGIPGAAGISGAVYIPAPSP